MSPTAEWPEVERFRDHWTWRPEWTASRPRVLWYLTFVGAAELHDLSASYAEPLRKAGTDVIPPQWLHLTVTDVGFADQLQEDALPAVRDAVRRGLSDEPPLELTLGPIRPLHGAVVLAAQPADRLRRLRQLVRQSTTAAGIPAPDDIDGPYWPHVSLCYVNSDTDQDALWEVVRSAQGRTLEVGCGELVEVLVARRKGHYQWDALETVRLETPAAPVVTTADDGPDGR